MPLRETRRFKTKGFVISFGDLMLPLVGLVAVGLLVVAGKIFFFSSQADNQPIPISVAPPDTPRPQDNFNIQRADASESVTPSFSAPPSSAEPAPAITPKPADSQPEPVTPPPSPKPVSPGPAAVVASPAQPARPQQIQQTQTQPTWKVQVGAYSTKASADSVVKNLAQAGHTAAVISGRLHRVLVQAGTTRQDAAGLAARLRQSGYPGAFTVAP